jgi:heme exporter protein C
MTLAIGAAFLVIRPATNFPYPDGARSIVFHVPCAWLAILASLFGAGYAGLYLIARRGDPRRAAELDRKSATAMELGLVFAFLTTITGSIFSRLEWGAYWTWDPRQTSILINCLIFAAYVVLRGAITDPDNRARLSAAYAMVSVVPGIFLFVVLPRIMYTLHSGANDAIIKGGLGGNYRLVMYSLALPAFLALFAWMYQLRVRSMRLEARAERQG